MHFDGRPTLTARAVRGLPGAARPIPVVREPQLSHGADPRRRKKYVRYAELKKLANDCKTTSARSSRANSIDEGPGVVTGAFGGVLHPLHQPPPPGGRIDIPLNTERSTVKLETPYRTLRAALTGPAVTFVGALDDDVDTINRFYRAQEKAAIERCDELEHQLVELERAHPSRLARLAESAPAPFDRWLKPAAVAVAHRAMDVQFDPENGDGAREAAPDALSDKPQTIVGSRRALKSSTFELIRTVRRPAATLLNEQLNHLMEYRSINLQGLARSCASSTTRATTQSPTPL